MTEEMKDAIRQMVAGTDAGNLERVGKLSDDEVTAELGAWSANKVYWLTQEAASLSNRLAEVQASIDLLTPFVDQTVQTSI